MKRTIIRVLLAASVAGMLGAAPAGAQEVTVCMDAEVVLQGETVVDESQCHTLPPA